MSTEMTNRTIGGTLAFCDWQIEKGYGTQPQIDPRKTALKKVFSAVEGDGYESFDWSELDLDEYMGRFQRLAGSEYKTESIVAYARRVRNAFDAHVHYLETGRPPAARPAAKRQKPDMEAAKAPLVAINGKHQQNEQVGMVTFPYPLDDGRMISITIPPRLKATDVNRITAFIRTLQDDSPERKQLPPGEDVEAA